MNLLLEVIFNPKKVLNDEARYEKQTIVVFIFSFILVFAKSFFAKTHPPSLASNDFLRLVFSMLTIPQVAVTITYVFYFVFISVLFTVFRFFSKNGSLRSMVITLMAISPLGILVQIFYFILNKSIKFNSMLPGYIFYTWVIILTILALNLKFKTTSIKTILIFFAVAIPFIFLFGLPVISPYLMYLRI